MPDVEERIPISTIGHSTRPAIEFLEILAAHGVQRLADIRTIPRSRHNPQFNRENFPVSLRAAGIAYRHMPGLGGLRRPRPDSINAGWRNASFRGFADYMQTAEFATNLEDLIHFAAGERAAIMCAEAVPWRCHRSLIADALVARGIPVLDLFSAAEARPHRLTPFARIEGAQVTYPGANGGENLQLQFDGLEGLS